MLDVDMPEKPISGDDAEYDSDMISLASKVATVVLSRIIVIVIGKLKTVELWL